MSRDFSEKTRNLTSSASVGLDRLEDHLGDDLVPDASQMDPIMGEESVTALPAGGV